jgi:hypothetical protein
MVKKASHKVLLKAISRGNSALSNMTLGIQKLRPKHETQHVLILLSLFKCLVAEKALGLRGHFQDTGVAVMK